MLSAIMAVTIFVLCLTVKGLIMQLREAEIMLQTHIEHLKIINKYSSLIPAIVKEEICDLSKRKE